MTYDLHQFEAAFEGVLKIASIPGVPPAWFAWPGRVFTPVKGQPYVQPAMAARAVAPVGLGANATQLWQGTYQVAVYAPQETGTRVAEDIAGAVMSCFPRGTGLMTRAGLVITLRSTTAPAPVPFGDWTSIPVQIGWFASEP